MWARKSCSSSTTRASWCGSVIGPSESTWSWRSSAVPNGPPITKQTSRPPWRRSSRNAAKPSEECSRARRVEQHDVGALGDPALERLVLAHLDDLDPRLAAQQLLVVLDVVGERRAQPPDREHEVPHLGDTRRAWLTRTSERHINLQTTPEIMAGHYANFANVSHSDYEFSITFARVDHEVEDEEVPGVVVTRVNLSPRLMRELIDALEDNYGKWRTREGIKSLPEIGEERHGRDPA